MGKELKPSDITSIERFLLFAARTVAREARQLAKEQRTDSDDYLDSPDREILTPMGLRLLLGDVGDKAVTRLVREGIPTIKISNCYRFHRKTVLEWLAEKSKAPANQTSERRPQGEDLLA